MTDPIDKYVKTKEAARTARKQNEIDLWQHWKKNGEKPEHLEPLLKLYDPNLDFKAKMWKAPTVPKSAFKLELQDHLIKAFQSFDPDRNVALNTHVEMRLHKAKRYNVKNQNLAYIPEGQVSYISKINKAHDTLSEEYGRPPTSTEIADHLGMTPKRVETIQRAIRKDIPGSTFESEPPETLRRTSYEEQQIAVASGILPHIFPDKPEMHTLFNYTFGTNEHPRVTSTNELAKKMGKSPSQISRMKTTMGNHLKDKMGLSPNLKDD